MLFQNAAIHYDHQSGLEGARGRVFVSHAFLQPHGARSQTYRLIDVLSSLFGAAKNVHQIELFRRVGQGRVSPLAQNFNLIRIDRDDAVTALLHVARDAETGANRVGRQSDDRDRFALVEDSFDNRRVVDSHILKSEKLTAKTPRSPRGPPIVGLPAVFFLAILASWRLIH